jgi:hypothetical protein
MNTNNLTPRENEIVDYLPATHRELSDAFGFSQSTSRDHIAAIERKGAPIANRRIDVDGDTSKEFYLRDESKQHPSNKNETREYGSTAQKAAKTKRLNETAERLSKRLDKTLNASEPAVSDVPLSSGGEEDVAIHVTDDHIGDKLEDEFGNEVFNTEIAIERIRYRVSETLDYIERQKEAGYDFHTCHYIMGGDIMTGTGIYEGQSWEVEKNFNEQIDIAVEEHFKQIQRLAEEFEAVQVVCQTGNHGEIRISGSAEQANGDDIIYRMLDAAARYSAHDNITFIRNDRTGYTNFKMRGHSAHLRHGQSAGEHIGTAAKKRDWRGWKLQHGFDIAYLGHYHIQGQDRVMEAPVIRSGSIKPPGDFEESISEWSMPACTIHGVSDDTAKTWSFDVNFTPKNQT